MTNKPKAQAVVENLTANEKLVLLALYHNAYGERGDGVYSSLIESSDAPTGLPKSSLPGIVGSLSKKSVLRTESDRVGDVIWLTELGREVIELAAGE